MLILLWCAYAKTFFCFGTKVQIPRGNAELAFRRSKRCSRTFNVSKDLIDVLQVKENKQTNARELFDLNLPEIAAWSLDTNVIDERQCSMRYIILKYLENNSDYLCY